MSNRKNKTDYITFTDAAAMVLSEHGNGGSMHYKEITRIATKEPKLIETRGETPWQTMHTQIQIEISKKENPRFVKTGVSLFALSPNELNKQKSSTGEGRTIPIDQNINILIKTKSPVTITFCHDYK